METPLACFFASISPSSTANPKPLVKEANVWCAVVLVDFRPGAVAFFAVMKKRERQGREGMGALV